MRSRSLHCCALLSVLFLLACGDDSAADVGPVPDVGADAENADVPDTGDGGEADTGPSRDCDPPLPFDEGVEAAPVVLGEGVVAGRVNAAQLPPNVLGLSEWRDGDFVLANDQVAVLFTQIDHPGQTYDPYGGRLEGIMGVDGDSLVDAGAFSFNILTVGRFLIATRSITVMNDGSDGSAAVIRVTGPLAPFNALGDVVNVISAIDYTGSEGAIDYTLEPGSNAIDVTMRVSPHRQVLETAGSLQVFFQANRMPSWRPHTGFADAMGPTPLVAFTDDEATSYAWTAPRDGMLTALISTSGADIFSSGPTRFACGENVLPLGRIVIGTEGGMPSMMESVGADGGDATETLSGRVVDTAGDGVTGVRVHAVGPTGDHLSRFIVDETGAFSVPVDARATELFVWRKGFPLAGPFAVTDDNQLEVPVASTISIHATEGVSGEAMPVKVEVFRTDGEVPVAPDTFGERAPGGGRVHFENPSDGVISLEVPAGEYRVRVGRGPTYERFEQVVTVGAAETVLDVAIDEVFPNPGVLCGDFHLHTHGSIDSPDRADDKLRSIVANGVQIAIRTEHEVIRDFQPIIDDLGLAAYVRGFTGLELSTVEYGHFNTFPMRMTDGPGNGAPLWPGMLPTELFDSVRTRPETPTLIINHPRSGGALSGYFNAAEYDPVTGTAGRPEMWDEEFRVVEVFNDNDFEASREDSVADWFSLLNQGRRIAAVGSSDSHRIHSVPPGYPRTCLSLGTDDPAELTGSDVQAALERGASVIYGGIDVRITGPDGAAPGDTVTTGASATFNVTLIAADYVEVNRLEVIVDGVTTQTIAIDSSGAGVRYDEDIVIDVAAGGSWVVFHAAGDEGFNANGSRPFGVTNPVFLER